MHFAIRSPTVVKWVLHFAVRLSTVVKWVLHFAVRLSTVVKWVTAFYSKAANIIYACTNKISLNPSFSLKSASYTTFYLYNYLVQNGYFFDYHSFVTFEIHKINAIHQVIQIKRFKAPSVKPDVFFCPKGFAHQVADG